MCKSAKDRTSMSVTLEHTRILEWGLIRCRPFSYSRRLCHNLPPSLSDKVRDAMRSSVGGCGILALTWQGVRMKNVMKNIKKNRYAFNHFQRMFLPKDYRPPSSSIGWGLSS